MRPRRLSLAVLLTSLLLAFPAYAFEGRVVGVTDGDTITVLTHDKQQVKVRLAEIDTPEKRQDFGMRAKQALSGLVFNREVRVDVETTDRYGRTVGRVYRLSDGLDVNAEMVAMGMAWVYRRYARDVRLYELEREAKAKRIGLWSQPNPIPPWEWRHHGRKARKPAALGALSSTPSSRCGAKRYCSEMASCKEAMFYLKECGLNRLDGDGDGIPCEKLCR